MAIPSTTDTILWRLHLRSSPADVYRLLTTDEGRGSFWSESTVETDCVVEFRAKNGNRWPARILEQTPPRRFVLEYGGVTTFELEDDGDGGTDLTLTNTGFEPDTRDDALPGWLNILLPLKARADFGVDLRNDDPARDWSRGYVDH
ncbi:MAG: hypothetical protein GEU80_16065 [Dehalococcoidia bacterium]|nr:hypothetical protein [Dehalococcoidia bacterium]